MTPGTLWPAIVDTTRRALAQGDLQPVETRSIVVEDAGIPFVVRVAGSLRRKRSNASRPDAEINPFLPPEAALTVGPVGEDHVAVLNKFNVVEHHLLVVTKRFEHQEQLLNAADFVALWRCLADFPSLGFYNGGRVAGASQPHKHLQVVPLPLSNDDGGFPLARVFDTAAPGDRLQSFDGLPFRHAFAHLSITDDLEQDACRAQAAYRRLLAATGVECVADDEVERQGRPYNLLATRQWLFLAPRSAESAHGISINSLGYAGSLFVPEPAALDAVRAAGPLKILASVSMPR